MILIQERYLKLLSSRFKRRVFVENGMTDSNKNPQPEDEEEPSFRGIIPEDFALPTIAILNRINVHYGPNAALPGKHDQRKEEIQRAYQAVKRGVGTVDSIELVADFINSMSSPLLQEIDPTILATSLIFVEAARERAVSLKEKKDGEIAKSSYVPPQSPQELRDEIDGLEGVLGRDRVKGFTNVIRQFQDAYEAQARELGNLKRDMRSSKRQPASNTAVPETIELPDADVRKYLHPTVLDEYNSFHKNFLSAIERIDPSVRGSPGLRASLLGIYREAQNVFANWNGSVHTLDNMEAQIKRLTTERDELSDGVDGLIAERNGDYASSDGIGTIHDLLRNGKAGLELLQAHAGDESGGQRVTDNYEPPATS